MLSNVTEELSNIIQEMESNQLLEDIMAVLLDVQHILMEGQSSSSAADTGEIETTGDFGTNESTGFSESSGTDCSDIADKYPDMPSGIYSLEPDFDEPFDAFCDMEDSGVGWVIFQRRFNGSVDFYRDWDDYKHGFGDVESEHWLGLAKLHRLTSNGRWMLRVTIEDPNGHSEYIEYKDFYIGSEETLYALHIGLNNGTLNDSMKWNNMLAFSTKDRDNDSAGFSCAKLRQSAWWYKYCTFTDLNSVYADDPNQGDTGLVWWPWTNAFRGRTIVKTEMKARPLQ